MGRVAINGSIDEELFRELADKCVNGNPRKLDTRRAQRVEQDDVTITLADDGEGVEALQDALEYFIYDANQP